MAGTNPAIFRFRLSLLYACEMNLMFM
jgi:hypothetical protein